MNNLVYSAYAKKPRAIKAVKINIFEVIAMLLSIISYSLIVSQNYILGFFIGFIGSVILTAIMLNKKSIVLAGLYIFFIFANLTGFYNSLQINA